MFSLSFNTDNEAFDKPFPNHAVADVLREVARGIANGRSSGKIFDPNGNTIGQWHFSERWRKSKKSNP